MLPSIYVVGTHSDSQRERLGEVLVTVHKSLQYRTWSCGNKLLFKPSPLITLVLMKQIIIWEHYPKSRYLMNFQFPDVPRFLLTVYVFFREQDPRSVGEITPVRTS